MAEESKTILLDIQFANPELITQATALRVEILALTQAKKGLEVSTDAYTETTAQLKDLQSQYGETNKQIIASVQNKKEEIGSVNQLAAELKRLTLEYNKMGTAQKNSAEGKAMQKSALETKEALNKAREAIGNFTGSVGNYAIAGGKMNSLLAITGEKGSEAAEVVKKFGEVTVQMGGNVKQTTQALYGMVTGTTSAAEGMNILKVAFASTGIGLLVIALAALIAYFTQTNEGAKSLKAIMAGVSAVLENLAKVAGAVGKVLVDILSGSFKDIAKDAKEAGDRIAHFAGNTAKAAKTGYELERVRQAQAVAERKLTQEITEKEGQLQVADIYAHRRDLGSKERYEALNKVKVLRNEIETKEIQIKQNSLDLLEKQEKLESKIDYADLARAKRELTEAKNKKLVGEATDEATEGRIKMKEDREDAKAASKANKLGKIAERARQKEKDELDKAIDNEKEAAKEILYSKMNKEHEELARLTDSYAEKLALAKKHHVGEKTLLEQLEAEKAQIIKKYIEINAKEQEKEQKRKEAQIKENEKDDEENLKFYENISKQKKKADEEEAKNKEILEQMKFAAVSNSLQSIQGLVKNNSILGKAAAIADIGVNAFAEISGYFKSYADKGPVGIALAVASSALATVRAATAISQIKSQKGFSSGGVYESDGGGGYISGAGSETSDSINARLSNKESVINARSTAMFYDVLSGINQAGGGKAFGSKSGNSFASGGVFTDGGNANRYFTAPLINNESVANSLAYQLINNPTPIYTTVTDIVSKTGQVNRIQDKVTL